MIIKSLILQIKTQLKKIMSVLSDRKASTTTSKENWFLPTTTKPPVPQIIQIEAEIIDQDHIFSSAQPEKLIMQINLMTKYQQSYYILEQSLKSQQKLSLSSILMWII